MLLLNARRLTFFIYLYFRKFISQKSKVEIKMKRFVIRLIILNIVLTSSFFGQVSNRGAGNKPSSSTAEKRLALVIGNGAYKNTTLLENPANDATDMAKALETLGFEVLSGTNQSKKQIEVLIRQFGDKLAKQGGVGLFFYAGHGLQVNGNNYLIPVEADIPEQDEVEYAAVNLNFLLGKMDAAQNNLNIVILDACRNNPFARSWRGFRDTGDGKGLAKVTPPTGTLMLYATQPGNVASDGSGRNGLFTESLLKQISKPNVELDQMIKFLARDVSEKSGKKQLPWKEGIVLGDFYFAGTSSAAAPPVENPAKNPPPSVVIDPDAGEREAWNQIKDSANRADFELFVETFPNGIYAGQAKANWESVWWNSIKSSSDKSAYTDFLKQFPGGQYAGAAKFAVKRLETAATVAAPTNNGIASVNKTAGAISKARLANGIEMSFAYIPAGSFEMGSNNGEADEKPIHTVRISQGFQMQTTEVTQAQWKAVVGALPTKCDYGSLSGDFVGDEKPVICVSWDDAQEFARQMNAKNDGFKYRLPSEAEWEYAARAGTTGDYAGNLDSMAWYSKNAGGATHEVGTKSPNGWGLSDMHGNVWEWVQDWHGAYPSGTVTGPVGAASGSFRVFRGGSWGDDAEGLRSAYRSYGSPSKRFYIRGFRLLRQ